MLCLSVVQHVPKIQYGGAKTGSSMIKPFVVICGSHHILSSGAHRNKFLTAITHVFEVQLFNGVVDDVTGSRVIPEIDMAAAQNRK